MRSGEGAREGLGMSLLSDCASVCTSDVFSGGGECGAACAVNSADCHMEDNSINTEDYRSRGEHCCHERHTRTFAHEGHQSDFRTPDHSRSKESMNFLTSGKEKRFFGTKNNSSLKC